ncbi:MAG TPA: hypothetical protein PK033_13015, partial [Acetivibrio sp.]|nr:hypothetical protein [Acetivibrio sp.]
APEIETSKAIRVFESIIMKIRRIPKNARLTPTKEATRKIRQSAAKKLPMTQMTTPKAIPQTVPTIK